MKEREQVLVLRKVPYGDNRVVIQTFSRNHGPLALISSIGKSPKAKLKASYFQTLSQLEVLYHSRSKGELKTLTEASVLYPYHTLYYDPMKSGVVLFLGELLPHVLREEQDPRVLFDFLSTALQALDRAENYANFHLCFLMELTAYLGFSPDLDGMGPYFDLHEGQVVRLEPNHPYVLDQKQLAQWRDLQRAGLAGHADLKGWNGPMRSNTLQQLIDYYRLQMHDFGSLKSLGVLQTLWS